MRRIIVVLALLSTACVSAGSDGATTTTATSDGTPPTTTNTSDTTQATTPPAPQDGMVFVFENRVLIRNDDGSTLELEADFEIPLRAVFGDGNGGLIYQYSRQATPFPLDAVLHLRAGTTEPEVVAHGEPGTRIRLVDAGLFQGLAQILFIETEGGRTRLLAQPLAGGSPVEVSTAPGIVDGSIGGDLLTVAQRSVGCPAITLLDGAGAQVARWDCTDEVTDAHVASNGSKLVALAGVDRITFYDVDDEDVAAEVDDDPSDPIVELLDFDGEQALAAIEGGVRIVRIDGTTADISLGGELVTGAILHPTADLPETAFLGGIRSPDLTCSAAGLPVRPPDQEGLPGPVSFIRTEIVQAATACDYEALADLTAPEFTYSFGDGGDPVRAWVLAEQSRDDVLAQIVSVLSAPHATIADENGNTLYVWPSAFGDNPTEADWEALVPIYNEEEVDDFRANGYTGMRVIIRADGAWLAAVAGD